MRRRDAEGRFIAHEDDNYTFMINRKAIYVCIMLCCVGMCCVIPWFLVLYRLQAGKLVGDFLEEKIKCPQCPPCENKKEKSGF